MLFFPTLNIEKAFNPIGRVVSVFVILALAAPTLRAEGEGSDRDHGRFLDSFVGSWIIHIHVSNFTPTPNPPPPFDFDNISAVWEDGITTSSDPTQGTSYGVWKKAGFRKYLTKIVQVNSNGTTSTVHGGPLTLKLQRDRLTGLFYGFDSDATENEIDDFSGTVVLDRITFQSKP